MRHSISWRRCLIGILLVLLVIRGAAESAAAQSAVALPGPGEVVPLPRIREICEFYGLHDLWQKIERDPPVRPFRSTGFTGDPDDGKDLQLYPPAFLHDLKYWAGYHGEEVERLAADAELMIAVARAKNSTAAAEGVFGKVRRGNAGELPAAEPWGFGRLPLEEAAADTKPQQTVQLAKKDFVRTYEPTRIGLTWDKGETAYLDFTFSLMFPLFLGDYAEYLEPGGKAWLQVGKYDFVRPSLFFSGAVRGGQYIWSRPSAPVAEKRFNPQLFLRLWAINRDDPRLSSEKFLDLAYGHESNGQSIGSPETFKAQEEIYRILDDHPNSPEAARQARLSARDAISRGWDYVGLNVGWGWDQTVVVDKKKFAVHRRLQVKLRGYLNYGPLLQKESEDYHDWEGEGLRHSRNDYDGLTLQYSSEVSWMRDLHLPLTGQFMLTYSTGLLAPIRYNTLELELGAQVRRVPIAFWGRVGYNSDLIDYYRSDWSAGFRISIWKY